MREKYIEYIKVVVTAVGIAFLINLEVGLLFPNLSRLLEWVRLTLVILVPIITILLAMFLWRLIVPNRIEHRAVFSIYYDVNEGEVIPFMFEKPFLPQDMARQVLNILIDRQPSCRVLLQKDQGQTFDAYYEKRRKGHQLHEDDRPIWSNFVEYLMLAWTKGWALNFTEAQRQHLLKLKDITYSGLPATLQANPILRLLKDLEPKDIIEASHHQLIFSLPADFKLEHFCPMNEPRFKTQYLDLGILRMINKYLKVTLTFHGFHFWGLISTFVDNASPLFAAIPVSPHHSDYFVSHLPNLRRITFAVELQADFSVRYQMFGRTGRAYYKIFKEIATQFIDDFDESNYIAGAVMARRDRLWDNLAEVSQTLTREGSKTSTDSTISLDEDRHQPPYNNQTDGSLE
ncbi:hypothetical protein ACFLX4_03520 [Chloroflexota bacterium]